MADVRSSEEGTNIHGLFGAIIVEPPESKWLKPETGEELESGLFADIYTPRQHVFHLNKSYLYHTTVMLYVRELNYKQIEIEG